MDTFKNCRWLIVFFLFCSCLLSTVGTAQSYDCTQLSRRDKRRLKVVHTDIRKQRFTSALQELLPVYKDHPQCPEVQYLHGILSYNLNVLDKAIESFRTLYEIAPDYKPTISFSLGEFYMKSRDYYHAIPPLQYFLSHYPQNTYAAKAQKYLKLAQIRLQILADTLLNYHPVKLPAAINTDHHEYLPALSADNNALLFTRRIGGQEDIYMSVKDSLGKWMKARPLYDINTHTGNEGGHCFSADGRILIFTSCVKGKTFGSCDLMISFRRKGGRWSEPRNMGPEVNSSAWDSQPTLSPDGRWLYFVSTRDHRTSDIYYATRQDDGTYGDVKSIGAPINTEGNERAPFIAFDNETLYFASDGHPGLGGRDLFYSRKDSVGKWTTPVNLGVPINTPGDDGTLFINSSATEAYFSSDKDGSLDIYSFHPDSSISPNPVTYVEGYVYDSLSHERLVATVSIMRLRDSALISEIHTSGDGYFLSCLPLGEDYAFWVEKPGYLFYSSHHALIDTQDVNNPLNINIPLLAIYDITDSTGIILHNILFETASATLLPEAKPELLKLLHFLENNPDIKIKIVGHTDDVGSEEDNLILSRERAQSVLNYLLDKGISASRLSSDGMGESQALVPNDSPEHRALNRRTEVFILE